MPFTPAHVLAALPFRRSRLNLSAMVVGCLSPDFEYFLRLVPRGSFGHTLPGVVVLDLPLSMLILWLYGRYVKRGLYSVAPRLFPFQTLSSEEGAVSFAPRALVLAVLSILLGASTHIVWDSFTHPGFWPYVHLWFLHMRFELPIVGWIEMYKLLQYVSTLSGVGALVVLWSRWAGFGSSDKRRKRKVEWQEIFSALAVVCVALGCAALRTGVDVYFFKQRRVSVLISEGVVTLIMALWIEVVILGMQRVRALREWRASSR